MELRLVPETIPVGAGLEQLTESRSASASSGSGRQAEDALLGVHLSGEASSVRAMPQRDRTEQEAER